MSNDWKNKIYYGDNFKWLRQKDIFPSSYVDLIYLDPPFNSKKIYNVIYGKNKGAQAKAFEDFWFWSDETQQTYDSIIFNKNGINAPARIIKTIGAFHDMLGDTNLMAYLVMMTPRLLELHRVLKDTGSIFLHCDPTASHYLKIIMDSIFDTKNFRNEIIWRRTGAHGKIRRYSPIHDILLFYTKSNDYNWNFLKKPYMKKHVEDNFVKDKKGWRTNYYGNVLTGSGLRGGESGKSWRGFNPSAKNRHWGIPSILLKDIDEDISKLSQHEKLDKLYELGFIKIIPGHAWPIYERYLTPDDGQAISDIWSFQPYTQGTVFGTDRGIDEDVRWLSPKDKERLGYPTQKPEGLLERIIDSCCPKDGIVFDPFCGCGTALITAEKLKRKWIGIDITYLAVDILQKRLKKDFPSIIFDEKGAPEGMAGAKALAKTNPIQFQYWAVSKVGGTPNEEKDGGIDGFFWFRDGEKEHTGIIQIKGGHVIPGYIRDFKGTMGDDYPIGIFVTLNPPTKDMIREATTMGFYMDSFGNKYPKLQILTVEEIFDGKRPEIPQLVGLVEKRYIAKIKKTRQKKL